MPPFYAASVLAKTSHCLTSAGRYGKIGGI